MAIPAFLTRARFHPAAQLPNAASSHSFRRPAPKRGPLLVWLACTALLTLWLVGAAARDLPNFRPVSNDEGELIEVSHVLANQGLLGSNLFAGFFGAESHHLWTLPAQHVLEAVSFKLFGEGIAQARWVSVVAAVLILWSATWLALRWFGLVAALACGVLLIAWRSNLTAGPTGLPLLDVSRVARYDVLAVAFAWLAFVALDATPGGQAGQASAASTRRHARGAIGDATQPGGAFADPGQRAPRSADATQPGGAFADPGQRAPSSADAAQRGGGIADAGQHGCGFTDATRRGGGFADAGQVGGGLVDAGQRGGRFADAARRLCPFLAGVCAGLAAMSQFFGVFVLPVLLLGSCGLLPRLRRPGRQAEQRPPPGQPACEDARLPTTIPPHAEPYAPATSREKQDAPAQPGQREVSDLAATSGPRDRGDLAAGPRDRSALRASSGPHDAPDLLATSGQAKHPSLLASSGPREAPELPVAVAPHAERHQPATAHWLSARVARIGDATCAWRWLLLGAAVAVAPWLVFVALHAADLSPQLSVYGQRGAFLQPSFYLDNIAAEPQRFVHLLSQRMPRDVTGAAALSFQVSGWLLLAAVPGLMFVLWRGPRLLAASLVVPALLLVVLDQTKTPLYAIVLVPSICVSIGALLASTLTCATPAPVATTPVSDVATLESNSPRLAIWQSALATGQGDSHSPPLAIWPWQSALVAWLRKPHTPQLVSRRWQSALLDWLRDSRRAWLPSQAWQTGLGAWLRKRQWPSLAARHWQVALARGLRTPHSPTLAARPWQQAAAAAALRLVALAAGLLVGVAVVSDGLRAYSVDRTESGLVTPYLTLGQQLDAALPAEGLVLGPERFWWALHQRPYLSLRNLWFQWAAAGGQTRFVDLVNPWQPRSVIVNNNIRDDLLAFPPALQDEFRAFMDHCTEQLTSIDGPTYFDIQVYRVKPDACSP